MERERLLSRVGMQRTAPPDRSVQPKLPRGTAAAVPPPFNLGDPALCGSRPLVTPY